MQIKYFLENRAFDKSDQSRSIDWDILTDDGVSYQGSKRGAAGTELGTGFSNTDKIIASQGRIATNYAAGLARAYNGGGYTDWYLPSKNELNKLFLNRVAIGIIGFPEIGGFIIFYGCFL